MSCRIYMSCVVIPFALFLNGYVIATFNRPLNDVQRLYNISSSRGHLLLPSLNWEVHWSFVLSSFNIGMLILPVVIGNVMDKQGRKFALILFTLFGLTASICAVFAVSEWFYSPDLLLLSYVLFGCYFSSGLTIAPPYLAELSPVQWRGKIGILIDLHIQTGFTVGSILGLPSLLGQFRTWYVFFIVGGFLLVFHIFTLFFCPESPRYLFITCRNELESRHALKRLGRNNMQVQLEIADMREERESVKSRVTLWELLTTKSQWKPLFLGCACFWIHQTSGAITVNALSNIIFTKSGFSPTLSQYAIIGYTSSMYITYGICFSLIDKVGRKPLVLVGLGGMVVSMISLSIGLNHSSVGSLGWGNIIAILGMVLTMCFAALGPLSILSFIPAELFTQKYRARAFAICASMSRLGNIFGLLIFPVLTKHLHDYAVMVFSGISTIYWLFIYFFIPETKNQSFREISNKLRRKLDDRRSSYLENG